MIFEVYRKSKIIHNKQDKQKLNLIIEGQKSNIMKEKEKKKAFSKKRKKYKQLRE